MRRLVLGALALACGWGWTGAAHAQAESKWYVAAAGTLSLREDTSGTIANAPTPGNTVRTENSFEPGYGGHLAVGRAFGQLRIEGELGYARDTQDSYTAIVPATGFIIADVEEKTTRAMVSAYWDFSQIGPVQPYIGGGVGYAWRDLVFMGPRAPFPTEQPRRLIDESDDGFAWQAVGGLAAPLTETVDLTVQYRWFDAGDFEGVDARNEAITRDSAGHAIDVGVRLKF
jgi:OOP family OmpA-OmpF porin